MISNSKVTHEQVQYRFRSAGGSKDARVYFGAEQLTGMGGLPLLGQLEAEQQLVTGASKILRDWRVPGQVIFSLAHLLVQRTLLICAGREDGIDSNLTADDPGIRLALTVALNLEDAAVLASQPTVCRFENDFGCLNLYRLAVYLVFQYIAAKKKTPKSIRLDFDGSSCRTRGEQQGTSYRKYYDTKMYFPLFVFDEDGFLITAILRPGQSAELEMTVPVLKRLVKAFRDSWPRVEITVVMDAAFNDPKIYDWCEDNDVFYLIKLKANGKPAGGLYGKSNELARSTKIAFAKRHGKEKYLGTDRTKNDVESEIRRLADKQERKKQWKDLNKRVVRRYKEFMHRTGKGGKDKKQWRQERRVLALCTHDDWGERRSFWVTNIIGRFPEHLIENIYSSRGKAELFIKDAKAFRCDKLSCQQFFANQCRLLMHVLAYQLLYKLRLLLPKSMQSLTLASIRDTFINIPAMVKEKSRADDLILSGSFPYKNHMYALLGRLTALPPSNAMPPPIWRSRLKPLILAPPLPQAA